MWFRKRKPDPAEVIRGLRERVFEISADEVGVKPGPGHHRVWSVCMETGYPNAIATLVAVADGSTSLYFSNGGAIIGAGQHQQVRIVSERFIAFVDAHVDELAVTDAHPLPGVGRVRFYARTFDDALYTAEADAEELVDDKHPLSQLFRAGHVVITAVREASPPA